MLIPNSRTRRDGNNGKVDAVVIEGDIGLLEGVSYDDIQATYPTSSTEVYSYYLAGNLVAQIEVTYSNSSKNTLTRVRRI